MCKYKHREPKNSPLVEQSTTRPTLLPRYRDHRLVEAQKLLGSRRVLSTYESSLCLARLTRSRI
jgi:hypothetical protein